jgi:hypothetical protein
MFSSCSIIGDSSVGIEFERVKVVVFPDGRLDTENAARFLGLSPKTLAIMRSTERGSPVREARARVLFSG